MTAREYRFLLPEQIQAGRAIFRVRNAGTVDHQLVLVRLPEDFEGSLADQLNSPERVAVGTLALLPTLLPKASGTFAIDATPGRYGLLCFLPDPKGVVHSLKGMTSELQVIEPKAKSPP